MAFVVHHLGWTELLQSLAGVGRRTFDVRHQRNSFVMPVGKAKSVA
jgi:hypothetical protein